MLAVSCEVAVDLQGNVSWPVGESVGHCTKSVSTGGDKKIAGLRTSLYVIMQKHAKEV